jgi:hypothetical protein
MNATANLPRFKKAIERAIKETSKTSAEVLTRTARNVAFRAAQFTPSTTATKIQRDLRRNDLLPKLASRNLKRRQGKFTRQEHQMEMQRILTRRRSGARALRVSWAAAIMDLGGSFRGGRPRAGGSAEKGFGRKATPYTLVSHIRSAVVTTNAFGQRTDASDIPMLQTALNRAVEFVTADMEIYAAKKARETERRLSD